MPHTRHHLAYDEVGQATISTADVSRGYDSPEWETAVQWFPGGEWAIRGRSGDRTTALLHHRVAVLVVRAELGIPEERDRPL